MIRQEVTYYPDYTIKTVSDYLNDVLIEYITYNTKGEKHGIELTSYKNGKPKKFSTYINGLIHGIVKEYHESGNLRATYRYKNGFKFGLTQVFYEDGTLALETIYTDPLSERNFIKKEYSSSLENPRKVYLHMIGEYVNWDRIKYTILNEYGDIIVQQIRSGPAKNFF
jgi:antitoxin component YwqK of YwqJK toxin-antitoxin module